MEPTAPFSPGTFRCPLERRPSPKKRPLFLRQRKSSHRLPRWRGGVSFFLERANRRYQSFRKIPGLLLGRLFILLKALFHSRVLLEWRAGGQLHRSFLGF